MDPLSLCTFGVAVFQTGTRDDFRVLFGEWMSSVGVLLMGMSTSVSNTSKRAAGIEAATISSSLLLCDNDAEDLLMVHENESVQSLVLNLGYERTVVKQGRLVASKSGVEVV